MPQAEGGCAIGRVRLRRGRPADIAHAAQRPRRRSGTTILGIVGTVLGGECHRTRDPERTTWAESMSDTHLREVVSEALPQLRTVGDDAWHSLVDLGEAALPCLVDAFADASEIAKKATIVSVVSEYRSAQAFRFLVECLRSDADPVWKAALDGLVTLGGPDVRTALQDAIVGESQRKQEWIREAIIQVEAEIADGGACDSKQ